MLLLPILLTLAQVPTNTNWTSYGGTPEHTRYSPLKQINKSNVTKLTEAWRYDTADGQGASQTQPIVVDGVLYGITPKHKTVAVNAATGKLLWQWTSGLDGNGPNRGLVYWTDGTNPRILTAIHHFIYALNPKTGRPIESFGKQGRIDLREDLGRDPATVSVTLTTPGVLYKDLLIVGGRMPEALPAAPGDIRAYDVRTGKLHWSFHTIPHPGEFGYETWPKDGWTYSGAANNWSGMAVDAQRGIVFVPTGSSATDFYGADRLGDNLFSDSLIALNASTGERLWHFQAVKHDIWDRDFPSPPTLVTVNRNGKKVDAVAQTSKQGWLYLFDRVTGEPLFPMESRPFPPSDAPGEKTAEAQMVPLKPLPFARQRLTEDMLTKRTPAAHQWAVDKFKTFRGNGQFVPFAVDQETVIFPGFDGGAEYGGSAYDPETNLLYINANDVPWTSSLTKTESGSPAKKAYLTQCAVCHGDNLQGQTPQFPSLKDLTGRTPAQLAKIIKEGAGRMPAFPSVPADDLVKFLLSGEAKEGLNKDEATGPAYRFTGYHKFLDPDGYPAVEPPWGTLNAINLNTGEYAWKVPLGEYPELGGNTGTENYGGPIVTAGGVVFIAATNFDKKLRAFDKSTGKLLWEATLPFSANATPITYTVKGRQYVAVYASGGKDKRGSPTGGVYVAFALP